MSSDIYAEVSSRIETDWYPYHRDEWFTQRDICEWFDWREPKTKEAVSKKLYYEYTKDIPILEKQNKAFRLIDDDAPEIDWQSADERNIFDIVLPFGLQNYVKLFPKSVICVAGEPNAGKTAFLYNTILMNMRKHAITLYNSEMGREQMKERFTNFEIDIPEPAPFVVKERYDNFADIVHPDKFTVIDYIDADNEYWTVSQEISRIHKKLKSGLVVCAIQKREAQKNLKGQRIETDSGYGGTPTKKKTDLYVTMSFPGRLKIVKGKSWVDKEVNPNGMRWTYKLVGGAKFVQVERDFDNEEYL